MGIFGAYRDPPEREPTVEKPKWPKELFKSETCRLIQKSDNLFELQKSSKAETTAGNTVEVWAPVGSHQADKANDYSSMGFTMNQLTLLLREMAKAKP